MKKRISLIILACAIGLFAQNVAPKQTSSFTVAGLKTIKDCWAALKGDSDEVVRRKAFKKLLYSQESFEEAVAFGLKDRDGQIRKVSIYELFMKDRDRALSVMRTMIHDSDPMVCVMVIELSRSLEDKSVMTELATEVLQSSKIPEVRKAASKALGFDFFKEVKLYSNNPANDHEVICLQTIELPKTGWRLKLDESEVGHRPKNRFFAEKLDDSDWRPIEIGLSWEKQGVIYDGSFAGKRVPGNGVFAQMLLDAGIPVMTEEEHLQKRNEHGTV